MTKKLYLKNSSTSKPGLFHNQSQNTESSHNNSQQTFLVNNRLLTPYVSLKNKLLISSPNPDSNFSGYLNIINSRSLNIIQTSSVLNSSILNQNILYNNTTFINLDANPSTIPESWIYTIQEDNAAQQPNIQNIDQNGPYCMMFSTLYQIEAALQKHFNNNFQLDMSDFLSCLPTDDTIEYVGGPDYKKMLDQIIENYFKEADKEGHNRSLWRRIFNFIYRKNPTTQCYPIHSLRNDRKCTLLRNRPIPVPAWAFRPEPVECIKRCVVDYLSFKIGFFKTTAVTSNFKLIRAWLVQNKRSGIGFKGIECARLIFMSFDIDQYTTWDNVKHLTYEEMIELITNNLSWSEPTKEMALEKINKFKDNEDAAGHLITLIDIKGPPGFDDPENTKYIEGCYEFIFQNTWNSIKNTFSIIDCTDSFLNKNIVYAFENYSIDVVPCKISDKLDKPWSKDECEFCELRCSNAGNYWTTQELMDDNCISKYHNQHMTLDKDKCECICKPYAYHNGTECVPKVGAWCSQFLCKADGKFYFTGECKEGTMLEWIELEGKKQVGDFNLNKTCNPDHPDSSKILVCNREDIPEACLSTSSASNSTSSSSSSSSDDEESSSSYF